MPRPATPALATDCVVFDAAGRVLLIRREIRALQRLLRAAGRLRRDRRNGGGRLPPRAHGGDGRRGGALLLIGVYSDPGRDPRGHTCSVAFLSHITSAEPHAGDDAAAAEWVADWRAQKLAFDHAQIIADSERRAAQG